MSLSFLALRSSVNTTICRLRNCLIYWPYNIAQTKGPILKQRKYSNKHIQWDLLVLFHTAPPWKCQPERVMNCLLWCQLGNYTQQGWDAISKNPVFSLNQSLLYCVTSSVGKIHGFRNQETETGMAQIICFPSFLVTYSGKFCLPFPQLWVLLAHKGNGKSLFELLLPRQLLSRDWLSREMIILAGILTLVRRDGAVVRLSKQTRRLVV